MNTTKTTTTTTSALMCWGCGIDYTERWRDSDLIDSTNETKLASAGVVGSICPDCYQDALEEVQDGREIHAGQGERDGGQGAHEVDTWQWFIYIPEEGHWLIDGLYATKKEARVAYLASANRKRLPSGSAIVRLDA